MMIQGGDKGIQEPKTQHQQEAPLKTKRSEDDKLTIDVRVDKVGVGNSLL